MSISSNCSDRRLISISPYVVKSLLARSSFYFCRAMERAIYAGRKAFSSRRHCPRRVSDLSTPIVCAFRMLYAIYIYRVGVLMGKRVKKVFNKMQRHLAFWAKIQPQPGWATQLSLNLRGRYTYSTYTLFQ